MKRIKSHFKRNWQIYAVVAVVGIVAIWFVSYYREFYAVSDASIKPFYADVWGTASDWAMVVVAGATGILIWRTLNSQVEVQKTTLAQAKLAAARYYSELKPRLTFKLDDEFKPQVGLSKDGGFDISFTIYIHNNSSVNFKLVKISNSDEFSEIYIPPSDLYSRWYSRITVKFNSKVRVNTGGRKSIKIKATDLAGSEFEASLSFSYLVRAGVKDNPFDLVVNELTVDNNLRLIKSVI